MPSIERVPDAAPARAARRPAPADTAASQGHPRAERAPRSTAAQKPEPAANAADEAECVRIFQRLSLGENNPALLNRLKTLNCR